jgi:hypothetical protein
MAGLIKLSRSIVSNVGSVARLPPLPFPSKFRASVLKYVKQLNWTKRAIASLLKLIGGSAVYSVWLRSEASGASLFQILRSFKGDTISQKPLLP